MAKDVSEDATNRSNNGNNNNTPSLIPRIKLGDLGIARELDRRNMAETAIGTPYYLCPELCQCNRLKIMALI